MKIFSILLISIITIVFILELSCSERKINSDQLQQRNGLYYTINEEKPYSGKAVGTFKSGQKRTEQTFKNGKLHGLSTTWDSNGQKKADVSYQNGKQSGPYRTWYDNGQQEKEGAYKDDKEHGHWTYWYENRQKAKEGAYKDGKREGKWNFWTKDGQKLDLVAEDIDGNIYPAIKIGNQVWMAEDLKVTHYLNGDAIHKVTDHKTFEHATTGAFYNYDNNTDSAAIYGKLYNGYAVNDSRKIAPIGWHVPTDTEWQTLVEYLGGKDVAGGKMKETRTAYWKSPNVGATNESGFSALPGGAIGYGSYTGIGHAAAFWSSTQCGRVFSLWVRKLHYNSSEVVRFEGFINFGLSIRCIRD